MARKRRRYQGHPARVAEKRKRNGPPDAEELALRELIRMVRREATSNPQEGHLVGPLAAAAKRAAELICDATPGLEDDEHRHAVAAYFTERLGDVLDSFTVPDYTQWRRECLTRVS